MLEFVFLDPEKIIASDDFSYIEKFLRKTNRRNIGWHYFTDIAWMFSKFKDWPRKWKILDAGGGRGPIQFLLAELGFNVTNIDLIHDSLNYTYSSRYKMSIRTLNSFSETSYLNHLDQYRYISSLTSLIRNNFIFKGLKSKIFTYRHDEWRKKNNLYNDPIGTIEIVKGNLCNMPDIADETFDAIVSLSALEHIPYNHLVNAVQEIKRVLKPNSKWAVTTSGTDKDKTWFHTPSNGSCFSTTDLVSVFEANQSFNQNPEEILLKYRNCNYLQDNLAKFYFKNGNNGMPWGKWDPKYIPVGIYQ